MAMQFGSVSAEPVATGQRFGGRLLQGLIVSAGYLLFLLHSAVMVASGNYFYDPTGPTTLMILYTVGVTIWWLVQLFSRSRPIGGQLLGYKFVRTDTGEDAQATVLLKYVVQGLFESATFGIGTITLLVSYRDGQHWLDRSFNVVAVRTGSVTGAGAASPAAPSQVPEGPRVMPVQMPQRPAQGLPTGAADQFSAHSAGTVRPAQGPGIVPTRPAVPVAPAAAPTAPQPAAAPTAGFPPVATSNPAAASTPAVSSNPWAFPGPSADVARASSHSSPAPFAPPGQAPLTPVTTGSFAPPGQAPLAPVTPTTTTSPTATVARPAPSPSLLHDETVIDPEVSQNGPAVVLDDGQRITVEGPVVLGRNPSGPEEFPQARAVQVVDESMRLSKTHVVVLPVDGGIGVYDVGARNGVHLEVDGAKARLSAKEVHALPVGATVHFGGRNFRVDA